MIIDVIKTIAQIYIFFSHIINEYKFIKSHPFTILIHKTKEI